jgi:hypothetical protein
MRLRFAIARRSVVTLGLAGLAACGGDLTLPPDDGGGGTPDPAAITVQGGDGQDGTVGEELATPLAVRVTADGEPLAGQGVVFEANDGDGELSPDTTVSNGDGRATARWTLGGTPGAQEASAKLVAGGKLVRFTAQAAVGPPASIELVSGDGQTGEAFAPLSQPLVVRVQDRFGNPVAGVAVGWAVTAGRGDVSAATVATDDAGLAQVTWTLGFFLGTQRVQATVAGVAGSPVTFEASLF